MPLRQIIISDDNLSVKKIGWKRFNDFWNGEGLLPEYAGRFIKFAEVHVQTEKRKVVGIWNVKIERYKVLDDGSVCEKQKDKVMNARLVAGPYWGRNSKEVVKKPALLEAKRFLKENAPQPNDALVQLILDAYI